jgi:RNA polymerase subunit RPABC4/transcription elongation factor Spt4
VVVDETKRAEDIPCPKCGSDDVRVLWQERTGRVHHAHGRCRDVIPTFYESEWRGSVFVEHFHRHCQRCHYWWPTDDVLS